MEQNEKLRKYELIVIVDAKLTQEEKDSVCKDVADLINKVGGKIINSMVWLEKQKFTFQIKKHSEGTYYLINIEAPAAVIAEARKLMKLNESILRSAFTLVEKHSAVEAAKV